MTLRSPIVAMLWEQWRLTRGEAAGRLALGIAAASVALILLENGTTAAFGILLTVCAPFWLSLAKLNGGTLLGGYKPGFPFRLWFTRPVSTAAIVGLAMAYDAVSCALLYLASAALVGFAFGQPLPLFSVTVWIVAFHLGTTCVHWSTRSRVVPLLGSLVLGLVFFVIVMIKVGGEPSLRFEFSRSGNLAMLAMGFVSFAFTVAGVARQRRGGASTASRKKSAGYPEWMINLFRFPCPVSSATRAQVWFEMKTSGWPVLTIGLAVALLLMLLFALSIPFAWLRPLALVASMISVWAVPLALFIGGNAFGIRQTQGRMYASAFEATQPYGTARLAALKVLVRSACVLAALIIMGASLWASIELMSALEVWGVTRKGVDLGARLMEFRGDVERAFVGEPSGYEYVVQAVSISLFIVFVVAARAAFTALRARYPRQLVVGVSLLLFCILSMALLGVARQKGVAADSLVSAISSATAWIGTIALTFSTVYLCWSGFRERALTVAYACGALVLVAASGLSSDPGSSLVDISVTWLLPLAVLVLAPWSLSRIRHA
jgi:hypothetical protein